MIYSTPESNTSSPLNGNLNIPYSGIDGQIKLTPSSSEERIIMLGHSKEEGKKIIAQD